MKKKYLYIIAFLLTGIFTACNDNIDDDLPGVDDKDRPTNTEQYNRTISSADYTTIVKGLRANKNKADSAIADELNSKKIFTETLDAHTLIPKYLIPALVISPNVGASMNITYEYSSGRDAEIVDLSTAQYTLASTDYAVAWGNPSVDAFTPAKSAESNLPAILLNKFGAQPEGTYKSLSYYYSKEEPIPSSVIGDIHHKEGFENNPSGAGSTKKVDVVGWLNVDLSGSIFWQCREYSSNKYAQVSSFKSGTLNDVWLISPQVDLTSAASPRFSFDIVVGNYNVTCLKILISDNFDGNQANISTATWTDITSSFTLPTPASGYSQWESAGSSSLNSYKGKKVYMAFRYEGDDLNATKKTTTYQLDNFKVYEEVLGLEVAEKSKVYDLYVSTGSAWKKSTDSNIIILQPEDYEAMGLSYLTTAKAPTYLPVYLKNKYMYAQEGDSKRIVYRTSATACYADEYSYVNGLWTANAFTETLTEQFVFASTGEWIFDPTIVYSFSAAADYQVIVDYVKTHEAVNNSALVHADGDREYYYGFSAKYLNITYRDVDRNIDPTFPAEGTREEKLAFLNRRTETGLEIFLTLQFPDGTPIVNGVTQEAKITVKIYDLGAPIYNVFWTYKFKCVGDKDWEFVERVSDKGEVNKAGEY